MGDARGFLYIGEQLGEHDQPQTDGARIVTIVWRGKGERRWGFLKHRDGRWCWIHWKEYVFHGGGLAPCGPAIDEVAAKIERDATKVERDAAAIDAEVAAVEASIRKGARRAGKRFQL